MTNYRVTVDQIWLWEMEETVHSWAGFTFPYAVEAYRPQTLHAKFWRVILGG